MIIDSLYFAYSWIGWVGGVLLMVLLCLYIIFPRYNFFQFTDLIPIGWKDRCYHYSKIFLLSILFALISIFLMRPQGVSHETIQKDGIDIVIALDVSGSMKADDFAPNRMHVAKEVLHGFVGELEADRVGLVVFSGKPFVSLPLSYDYALVQESIQRVSTEIINQNIPGLEGTAIGDALLSSLNLLEIGQQESDIQREQVILLLTDGEANRGVDPKIVARKAEQEGVKIYTVGIGSIEGGMVEFATAFGTRRQPVGGIDEEVLQTIAQYTNGMYRRATDSSTFESILEELAELEKTEFDEESFVRGNDVGYGLLWWIFAIIVILLLDSYFFRGYDNQGRYKRNILIILFILTVIALVNPRWIGLDEIGSDNTSQGDSMIMLDVSKSMNVEDIDNNGSTISRLLAGKERIATYLNQNPDLRIGLGIFAGEAVSVLPMSRNTDTVFNIMRGVSGDSLTKQGTDIIEAIRVGVKRFVEGNGAPKTLILITDGGDEEFIIPTDISKIIQEKNITLMHVLIGTEIGGPIPERVDVFGRTEYIEFHGETVISRVDLDRYQKNLNNKKLNIIEHMTTLDQISGETIQKMASKSSTSIGLIQYGSMVLAWFAMVVYLLLLVDTMRILGFIRSINND